MFAENHKINMKFNFIFISMELIRIMFRERNLYRFLKKNFHISFEGLISHLRQKIFLKYSQSIFRQILVRLFPKYQQQSTGD